MIRYAVMDYWGCEVKAETVVMEPLQISDAGDI